MSTAGVDVRVIRVACPKGGDQHCGKKNAPKHNIECPIFCKTTILPKENNPPMDFQIFHASITLELNTIGAGGGSKVCGQKDLNQF